MEAVPLVRQIFGHIISHGGSISRWRSLAVRAKIPDVLFEVIAFINSSPMLALQIVSLNWRIQDYNDDQQSDIHSTKRVTKSIRQDLPSLTSGPQYPQLSRVELVGLTTTTSSIAIRLCCQICGT